MKHLSLDFSSGLDPEGIRVRNAQGLDAVDFFFPGMSGSPSHPAGIPLNTPYVIHTHIHSTHLPSYQLPSAVGECATNKPEHKIAHADARQHSIVALPVNVSMSCGIWRSVR